MSGLRPVPFKKGYTAWGRRRSQAPPNCNCLGRNEDILRRDRDRGAPPFSCQTETMSPQDTGMSPRVSDWAGVWRQPEAELVSCKDISPSQGSDNPSGCLKTGAQAAVRDGVGWRWGTLSTLLSYVFLFQPKPWVMTLKLDLRSLHLFFFSF